MELLSVKELEVLMYSLKVFTCNGCPHKQDREVCSCDRIYYVLEGLRDLKKL